MAECSVIHVPSEKAASPNSAVNSNQGEINLIWPGVSSGQLFSWLTWKWGLLYKSGYYHSSTVITVSYMCPCCLLRQYLYSSSELLSRWGSSGLWQGAGGSCIDHLIIVYLSACSLSVAPAVHGSMIYGTLICCPCKTVLFAWILCSLHLVCCKCLLL